MPLAAVVGSERVMASAADAMISITYGGEALSLAAARATLECYRDEPVVETLWARGRQLREGLTAVAAETGLPFEVVGYDPMTAMTFTGLDGQVANQVWSYLLQEMATRGVLLRRGGRNFVSYSHTEAQIATCIEAARAVFAELAGHLEAGSLAGALRVQAVDARFREFR